MDLTLIIAYLALLLDISIIIYAVINIGNYKNLFNNIIIFK